MFLKLTDFKLDSFLFKTLVLSSLLQEKVTRVIKSSATIKNRLFLFIVNYFFKQRYNKNSREQEVK